MAVTAGIHPLLTMATYTNQNLSAAQQQLQALQAQWPNPGQAIGPVVSFLQACDADVSQRMVIEMLQDGGWGFAVLEEILGTKKVMFVVLD